MFRKLILTVAVFALAGLAFADPVPPGPNPQFATNPWADNAADRPDSGFLPNMDYHMEGVYSSGSGMNTIWSGQEWGSGVAQPAAGADVHDIGALMCTMGIAVFAQFGIQVDLANRFYEIHTDANHEGYTDVTVSFEGSVGTNSAVNVGLRAPAGGFLQFPAGQYNPQVQSITIYKGGSEYAVINNPSQATEALFTHYQCHTTFRFDIVVRVPVHVNDGGSYLPFYFCPDSAV